MVRAEKLYFSYTGAPPYVLEGLEMEVRPGEYISVVGENGSGKSTLMRIILRFLKPTAGTVTTQSRRTGYVPQRGDSPERGFPITVFEALDSYRRLLRVKNRDAVAQALAAVGMEGAQRVMMSALSGGQSQRVLIARALLGEPDLLILDEPSTGVDLASQAEIYALIRRINRERGVTVLSVEHNLDAAVSNSTAIYHLVGGHGHMCTPKQYANEYLRRGAADGNA